MAIDNANAPDLSAGVRDENSSSLFGRPGEISHGLPIISPTSPSLHSLNLDQGQHMPHLLCSFFPLPCVSCHSY